MSSAITAPSSVARSAGAVIVQRIIGIAPAPLLLGEAEADYLGVAARIVAVAQPKDAIEEFLTRDVVDLTWEILRLRRLKGGLLRAAASKGVHRILSTIGYGQGLDMRSSYEFATEWASGNASTRTEFLKILKGRSHNERSHGRGVRGGDRSLRTHRSPYCKRGGAPQQRPAVSVANFLEHVPEIESLARRLAGVDADAEVLELARRVSEAQVDLNRVRAIRRRLIISRFADPAFLAAQKQKNKREADIQRQIAILGLRPLIRDRVTDAKRPSTLEGDDKLATILGEPEITTLDRYECRALSRRKFAIREFDQRLSS
jgi:hypothetical protein